jgi:hypothetical protein
MEPSWQSAAAGRAAPTSYRRFPFDVAGIDWKTA